MSWRCPTVSRDVGAHGQGTGSCIVGILEWFSLVQQLSCAIGAVHRHAAGDRKSGGLFFAALRSASRRSCYP